MKKLIMAFIVLIVLGALAWHYLPGQTAEDEFTLAALSLGASQDQVTKILGSAYTAENIAEPGHFTEPYAILNYSDGVSVVMGADSKQVLQIMVTTDRYQTGQGAKVGDSIADILDQYQEYETPKSNQGDEELTGWFRNSSGQLFVFDSNLADDALFSPVSPGAKVEQIVLTQWSYID